MKKLRKIIGNLIMLLGVSTGLYVGLWIMLIRPIIETAAAFDNGTCLLYTSGPCGEAGAVFALINIKNCGYTRSIVAPVKHILYSKGNRACV